MIKNLTQEEKLDMIRNRGRGTENLLRILLDFQECSGRQYVDEETASLVAQELELPLSRVYEVLTFYSMLHVKPTANYIIEVCSSAPCYFNHSVDVVALLEKILGIGMGETTPDGIFTLCCTTCVGACGQGPVMKIGETVYGRLDEEKIRCILDELRTAEQSSALGGS